MAAPTPVLRAEVEQILRTGGPADLSNIQGFMGSLAGQTDVCPTCYLEHVGVCD